VQERERRRQFEHLFLPHLGASYNLARWLTRSDHDAEDVVQEAFLRAVRSFDRYRGGDARSWLLTIVRNTCYTWLRRNRPTEMAGAESYVDDRSAEISADAATEPEVRVVRDLDRQLLRAAIEALPAEFREALVLRELEGFSYKEIAAIADVPLGTVMSRLARARQQLQQSLQRRMKEGGAR